MSDYIDEIWNKIKKSEYQSKLFGNRIIDELKSNKKNISPQEHQKLLELIGKFERNYFESFVPQTISYSIKAILKNKEINNICDPWAKTGLLLHQLTTSIKLSKIFGISQSSIETELGKVTVPNAHWETVNPLHADTLKNNKFDAITSILPFGVRTKERQTLNGVDIEGELASQILSSYSTQLKEDGLALFVVHTRFFTRKSAYQSLSQLGLYVDAVFELPAGTFAPVTSITSNLIVIKKGVNKKIFVGKLSSNNKINKQVINNYLGQKESKNIEFGCFANSDSFRGIERFRAEKEFERLKQSYNGNYFTLNEIAESVKLGKHGCDFEFDEFENSIYLPLIGKSDVVSSVDRMKLKQQNYAQLNINPNIVKPEFVIRYLNSNLGIGSRVMNMTGTTIPKLNMSSIISLGVFVPNLEKQKSIIETSHEIRSQKNKLSSLINELNEYEHKIWKNPDELDNINIELRSFQEQVSSGTSERSDQSLKDWIETLPFPLASILRAWFATSENDPKKKYEHLLHFFEALSLFSGIIFLSAFQSNKGFYAEYKDELVDVFAKNPIEHASFGTWKSMVEFFSKKVRDKLKVETETPLIQELFYDPSLSLVNILCDTRLINIITETNTYRNRWKGHGGVVGKEEAIRRNELLVESLNKLRLLMGDIWEEFELLTCESMKKKGAQFEIEVLVLMGSNSEFASEIRMMDMPLDDEVLYLHSKNNTQSLPLLPFIKMGSSPSNIKNACYFYNKINNNDEAKFVSYHYAEKPEISNNHDEIISIIKSLTEVRNSL